MKKLFGLIVFCVLLFALPVRADIWYVKKTGSDSNTCEQAKSEATPKATINAGLACVPNGQAGHAVKVAAGEYAEVLRGTIPSGSSAGPFTLEAIGGEVVLNPPAGIGGFHTVDINHTSAFIRIVGDWKIIKGGVADGNGIKVQDSAHDIVIDGAEITGMAGSGVMVSKTAKKVTVQNCHSHHNGGTDLEHGIYFAGADNVLRDCEINNNSGYGVHIFSSDRTAHRNLVERVFVHGHANKPGILLSSGDGNVVKNSISVRNRKGILVRQRSPNGSKVWNNTTAGNIEEGILIDDPATNTEVKNNVVDRIVDTAGGTVLAANLTTDPKFVDPSNGNLRLQAGSPAIDKGVTIAEVVDDFDGVGRPQGSAYDIGAFEFAQTTEPPTEPEPEPEPAPTVTVSLTWTDNSDSEDGFRIERSTDGSPREAVATLPAGTQSYTDSVEDGHVYCYVVVAFNTGGEGASPEACMNLSIPDPPAAPSNVEAKEAA